MYPIDEGGEESILQAKPRYWAKVPNHLDWMIPFVVAFISLVISGYVGYSGNDKEVVQRLAVVETTVTTTKIQRDAEYLALTQRLDRVQNSADKLNDKLDVLLQSPGWRYLPPTPAKK